MELDILVKHKDGSFLLVKNEVYEASVSGKCENYDDRLQCARLILLDKTGINCNDFIQIYKGENSIMLFCEISIDKNSILDSIIYKWVNLREFLEYLNSSDGIDRQKYSIKMGALKCY